MIESGEMPPEGEPPLAKGDRDSLVVYIRKGIAEVERAEKLKPTAASAI